MKISATIATVTLLLTSLVSPAFVLAQQAKIQTGDTLDVRVAGDSTLSKTVKVMDDGTVAYPVLGRVHVAGMTLTAAQELFTSELAQYERHPRVTVEVKDPGQWDVTVLGNVKTPGHYKLRSGVHVADAIAAAGGFGPTDGPLPEARITDPSGTLQNVSMQALFRDGNPQADVPLTDGSIIYVPGPTTINISVLGAVDHAGAVELNSGDRLSMAVAKAGVGTASKADLNHIYLTRTNPDGQKQTYQINLYKALQNDDPRYDVPMQRGDVVYVPQTAEKGGFLMGALFVLRRLLLGY